MLPATASARWGQYPGLLKVCHRDRKHHPIEKDSRCLVIKDLVSGGSKNCCPQCALAILDQAADDLQRLRDQLS